MNDTEGQKSGLSGLPEAIRTSVLAAQNKKASDVVVLDLRTAFAFTDSFWFNAVEAAVDAMAMFMLSSLFYVALLWERDMFKPRGNRWLMLICFIIGLSFGVHFMALLTIPAIGFLYFFKNYKTRCNCINDLYWNWYT